MKTIVLYLAIQSLMLIAGYGYFKTMPLWATWFPSIFVMGIIALILLTYITILTIVFIVMWSTR